MKGFYIDIANNLIEPKHYKNMGESVWLFMWLLDHITSINENGIGKVLNNSEITYETVGEELPMSRATYMRYVARLRECGYIRTARSKHGLIITVNKAKKSFGRSIKNATSKSQDVAKSKRRSIKNATSPCIKNATSLYKEDNNITINNNSNNGSNAPAAMQPKIKSIEIDAMFELWNKEVGYNIESRVRQNRYACSNMLKKHGAQKLERLVVGVGMAQADRFAPRIADFVELQSKLSQLLAWGKTKAHDYTQGKGVKI